MKSLSLPLLAALAIGCTDAGGDETGAARTQDLDTDGFTTEAGDCDDGDSLVYPGAAEVWYDGLDQDCDGNDTDQDLDGYMVADDCDDRDPAISPDGAEVCDGADNDCDGLIDVGAPDAATAWPDDDGDGHGRADGAVSYCGDLPAGYAANADDCDDADASSAPSGVEAEDLADNDCDGWTDEDFVRAGDVVITEVTRQTRFGASDVSSAGQWFEIYNASARDLDLSDWYVGRSSSSVAAAGFSIDPADNVVLAAGERVVFCKTSTYTAAESAFSTLVCDYVWSDPDESSSDVGLYRDNTFTLEEDEDTLALWVYGDATSGTLVDDIHWTSSASAGYWPRDASLSMSLDPAALDGTSNDDPTSWCSTSTSAAYRWYNVSASNVEYGTPGAPNYDCP